MEARRVVSFEFARTRTGAAAMSVPSAASACHSPPLRAMACTAMPKCGASADRRGPAAASCAAMRLRGRIHPAPENHQPPLRNRHPARVSASARSRYCA